MVASFCQLVTVAPRSTIIPYTTLFRSELVCASVAVQVRCVLLTSLPLTPRLASTNVTVRLVSHVSLNTGVPKARAAEHTSELQSPYEVICRLLLSIKMIVWLQVTELVCASV